MGVQRSQVPLVLFKKQWSNVHFECLLLHTFLSPSLDMTCCFMCFKYQPKIVESLRRSYPCWKVFHARTEVFSGIYELECSFLDIIASFLFNTFMDLNVSHVKYSIRSMKRISIVWFSYYIVWYKSEIIWNQKFYIKWGTFNFF